MPPKRTASGLGSNNAAAPSSSATNGKKVIPVVEVPVAGSPSGVRTPSKSSPSPATNSGSSSNKQATVRPSTPEHDALSLGKGGNDGTMGRSLLAPRNPSASGYNAATTPIRFQNRKDSRYTSDARQNMRTSRPSKPGFSLKRLAAQLVTLYALIAYFFICPNDPSRAPAVCESFARIKGYRNQAIDYIRPYSEPYQKRIQAVAQPYVSPYVKAATPYYNKANTIVRPQVQKAQQSYNKQVKPRIIDTLTRSKKQITPHLSFAQKEYDRCIGSHIARYTQLGQELYDINIHPYVDEITFSVKTSLKPVLKQYDATVQPLINKAYPAAKHHLKHTLMPLAVNTYQTSYKTYAKQIHPRIVAAGQIATRFGSAKVLPWLGRVQSKYVSPQISKIQDKAWAHKAKQVAVDKVAEMDADLGKAEILEEIRDYATTIKATAEATTVDPLATSTLGSITPVPSASGHADAAATIDEKEDALAHALRVEAAKTAQAVEERAAVEALHDLYEAEISRLGKTEQALLADRLATLRASAVRDIPVRFNPAVKSYAEECNKWVKRLEKYYEKAARDERTLFDTKLEDGNLIARKANIKLGDQAEELEDEIDAYLRMHTTREVTSTDRAFKNVEQLVVKAQEELGVQYGKLMDLSADDWKRYNTLGALQGAIHHEFTSMRDGRPLHPALSSSASLQQILNDIKQEVSILSQSVEERLTAAHATGEKKIRGQFLGVQDAVTRGYAAASQAISSVIGGTTVTPTDAAGTASSILSVATESVSSVGVAASVAAAAVAAAVADSAASIYAQAPPAGSVLLAASEQATQAASSASSLATAVALSAESAYSSLAPSASSFAVEIASSASSLASAASASASSAYASVIPSASSVASVVSASASSAASIASASASSVYASGIPEASSLASAASSSAVSLASVASSKAVDAVSAVSAAVLPTNVAKALDDASSTFQQAFGDASQQILLAFGATPNPTDASQTIASAFAQATGYVASLQSDASSLLAAYASGASYTAASLAGYKNKPTDLPASAASAYSVAAASAASLASEAAVQLTVAAARISALAGSAVSAEAKTTPVLEAFGSSIHSATRSVASAVGISVTPESLNEHAESAYHRASVVAASIAAAASSAAASNIPSLSAASASAASLASVASASAASLASAASSAVYANIPSVSWVSASAVSVASDASVKAASLASAASSHLHDVTRSAMRAVGATPSPEGVAEHIASAASSVSSAASSAAQAVRAKVEL